MNRSPLDRLRRDLGTLESYAAMIGILVGAGIFKVTSVAWTLTGSSVILAYLVLAPVILFTCVPYMVFLSTPLGRLPGGEYTHLSAVLWGRRLAFLGAWLKIISYLGALAYLARSFADYLLPAAEHGGPRATAVALGILLLFFLVHATGIRWFGRLQVTMCALLGLSIILLVVPGLFHVRMENYRPFFKHGAGGFMECLPPLFFAFAGFESVAHAAGEVRDPRRTLPRVFLRGILLTTAVFLAISIVAFGVLPGTDLAASPAPMADVAAVCLPDGIAWAVTLGALMAMTTSLNATMLVPARLGVMLASDGLLPPGLGAVNARTGTPLAGLVASALIAAVLIVSDRIGLALSIAVLALVLLYALHSACLLLLPRRRPDLLVRDGIRVGPGKRLAAAVSCLAMLTIAGTQVWADIESAAAAGLLDRWREQGPTGSELLVAWVLLGGVAWRLARRVGQGTAEVPPPGPGGAGNMPPAGGHDPGRGPPGSGVHGP